MGKRDFETKKRSTQKLRLRSKAPIVSKRYLCQTNQKLSYQTFRKAKFFFSDIYFPQKILKPKAHTGMWTSVWNGSEQQDAR